MRRLTAITLLLLRDERFRRGGTELTWGGVAGVSVRTARRVCLFGRHVDGVTAFSATSRPSCVSCVRQTSPMAPGPSGPRIR